MSLPLEAEELLDDLRRGVMDSELKEIAQLIETLTSLPIVGVGAEELRDMLDLEKRILEAYHQEGGYAERQHICEEIARLHG